MRTRLVASLFFGSLAVACLVPSVELSGRACDAARPCVDGFLCNAEGLCVDSSSASDASVGADGGSSDAGTCTHAFCDGMTYYACKQGQPVLAKVCAERTRCDQARGCLSACDVLGQCPSGQACDLASDACVTLPTCSPELECAAGSCVNGACVPTPSSPAEVALATGATEAADLDCYPAGLELVPGVPAIFKGFVLSALGQKTTATIGCSLNVYTAEEFAKESPPFLTTVVVDRPYQGPAGLLSAGGFELPDFPTGVALVAVIDGCEGAVPTHQYFSLPSTQSDGGEIELNLVSYAASDWQAQIASAGATVGKDRAGMAGEIFDCRDQPLRVRQATVALDTPGRAYYTHPMVFGVDPAARATEDTGRFFFFDVPATSLAIVTAELDAVQSLRTQTMRVRTVPGAVTLVSLRPAGR